MTASTWDRAGSARWIGRARRVVTGRFVRFGVVGATGLVVNTLVLAVVSGSFAVHYLAGAVVATAASTTTNFVLTDAWVFEDRPGSRVMAHRFLIFLGLSLAALGLRGPVLVVLTESVGLHYLVSNVASLLLITVLRFRFADSVIWPGAKGVDAVRAHHLAQLLFDPVADRREPEIRGVGRMTERVFVAAIVASGLALRVVNLGSVGFNSDEAVYAGQGGALLGVGELDQHFSIFRAHPLLLQLVAGSVLHLAGPSDLAVRLVVSVVFGLGTVIVTHRLARRMYGPTVGLAAAAIVAVLPYHVIISRQVLVDVPMAFFAGLGLLAAVRSVDDDDQRQRYLSFFWFGLAAISKEVAVLAIPVVVAWMVSGPARVPLRRFVGPAVLFTLVALPFPLTRLINQPSNASQFFLWQFTRDPNHSPDYFARVVLQFGGWAFLALFVASVAVLGARRTGPDQLLLWWVGVFGAFFQLWPTKLFPYLFLILPGMAIAAAVVLDRLIDLVATNLVVTRREPWRPSAAFALATSVLVASLAWSSGGIVAAGPAAELDGFGDFDIEVQTFAGSREFGEWALDSSPDNSRFLTIGPSLGNILRFYGNRDSVALSVSPDPAKRNPAYVPVANPNLALRRMSLHYIVWDAYSADRSAFYNRRLRDLARRLGGEIVFSVYADDERIVAVDGAAPPGSDVRIVVWDVPGAGTSTGAARQEGLS